MVMGGETEYAMSARDAGGRVVSQPEVLSRFLEHAHSALGYSSVSERGRFLTNGGFLYLDGGLHMEWATPECTCPFDVVRYLKAGDQIVFDLTRSLAARSPGITEVFCSRSNVDYLSHTLWAAHESYSHTCNLEQLPTQLIPFLASRVVFGAGGWDARSPGLRFTLSPRVAFITTVADGDTQYTRPLFHTKNEPLSNTGSHRLHVSCGETVCSETAGVVKFGATALVLALVERGLAPGTETMLASPLRALRRFAADPECRTLATLRNGRRVTALEIQRHYLERVEAGLDRLQLPDWAASVCALWRATLDALANGPDRAEIMLDWAIKRRLFVRRLQRHGIAWSSLRVWDAALTRVGQSWSRAMRDQGRGSGLRPPAFNLAIIEDRPPVLAAVLDHLTPFLAARGLSWSQLPAFVAARNELLELDARFAALGPLGIFNALDAHGALRHRVPGAELGNAVDMPPADTRARLRGEVVRRLTRAGKGYRAEWTGIYDIDGDRELDLADPLEAEERWTMP